MTRILDRSEIDRTKGHIVPEQLFIAHHEAVEAVEEISHIETIIRPNGKVIEKKVIDVPAVKGKPAWDEYKSVLVYKLYTEKELADREIKKLKAELTKIKEDIEQETFGLIRDDYAEKKLRAAAIINELRVLEGKEPRDVKTVEEE